MFKNILFPTDGSNLSENAARSVVTLAREVGARITALYVKPEYPQHYADAGFLAGANAGRFDELVDEEAQEILDAVDLMCAEAGVACIKVAHAHGAVHRVIIEVAAQNACDLIFMASHGRRGVDALLLGSETNKVLAHARVPVLVYR